MVSDMTIADAYRLIARHRAAQRRRGERVCAVCDQTFTAGGGARYCSRACQMKAYRRRQKSDAPDA